MSLFASKYLEFAQNCDLVLSKHKLTAYESKILRIITQKSLRGEIICVQNLLDIKDIASPATIHKEMKKLLKKKLIRFDLDKKDDRIKHLVPTDAAVAIFSGFGKHLRS